MPSRTKGKLFIVGLCCIVLGTGVLSTRGWAAETKERYTFAVVPQFPPLLIKRYWTPLLERIEHETGVKIELKHYRSIPDFEVDFLNGGPDFAYMNPYHAVMAKKAQGYIPLIRDGKRQLVGILVVRSDSPAKTVRDLNRKKIAFPSPNAFAASLYMRALLSEQRKITFIPKYVTTHSNVYRHVVLGRVAAGGGVNKTLKKEPQALKDRLRIIYETPGVAAHPICAHPRVPAAVRKKIVRTIMNLVKEEAGHALLNTVAISQPHKADYHHDYKPLERLGLEKYLVSEE